MMEESDFVCLRASKGSLKLDVRRFRFRVCCFAHRDQICSDVFHYKFVGKAAVELRPGRRRTKFLGIAFGNVNNLIIQD